MSEKITSNRKAYNVALAWVKQHYKVKTDDILLVDMDGLTDFNYDGYSTAKEIAIDPDYFRKRFFHKGYKKEWISNRYGYKSDQKTSDYYEVYFYIPNIGTICITFDLDCFSVHLYTAENINNFNLPTLIYHAEK